MALQQQVYELVFSEGMEQNIDSKLLLPAKLHKLVNGVFKKQGKIEKRFGYSNYGLNASLLDGTTTTLSDTLSLNIYNNELMTHTKDSLFSFAQSNDYWLEKGVLSPFILDAKNIVRTSISKTETDIAVNQNIEIYSYTDDEGLKCTVRDALTGVIYQYDTLINVDGYYPRCIAFSNYLSIIYIEDTGGPTPSIKIALLDMANPENTTWATYIVGANTSNGDFVDAVAVGNKVAVAWTNNKSPNNYITLSYVNALGQIGFSTPSFPDPIEIAYTADTALALFYNIDTSSLWIVGGNSATGISAEIYSTSFTLLQALTTVDATVALPLINITGEFSDTTTLKLIYEYDNNGGATWKLNHIATNTFTDAGVAGTRAVLLYNLGLASKAFKWNNKIFFATVYQSPDNNPAPISGVNLQSSYFIFDSDGNIRGTMLSQKADGYITPLPAITNIDSKYYLSLPKSIAIDNTEEAIIDTDNQSFLKTITGATRLELDFDSNYLHFVETINNTNHMSGGQVEIYDGSTIVEAGFHTFPEGIDLSFTNTGGSVPDSITNYRLVWKWTDKQGNVYRSAPSPVYTIDLTGESGANEIVHLEFPSLTATNKINVVCEIYRTVTSGTIFYKIGEVDNDITSATLIYNDSVNDASIADNEFIYVTGGVLENITPPSARLITIWNNRLWIVGEDDYIWYTKERKDDIGISFNDFAYRFPINPDGGTTTAIQAMDDNLIMFKETKIYYINGDGANDFGAGPSLSEMQLITSDVGCIDPNSLVLMPEGIMFKTRKGIYLLNRGLQIEYVGASVQDYNEFEVLSASSHPEQNEARFLIEGNIVLNYNYYFKQWSIFTNMAGIDAVVFQNQYVYLRSDSRVFYEDTTKFTDGGAAIPLTIETAWIKTAGVQGFQRVYWTHYLGNYEDAHKLRVQLKYDYSNNVKDLVEFDPNTSLDLGIPYGSESPYGTGIYGGSSDEVYQFRHKPKIQKCESIKFIISDSESQGAGYSLNHLLITVGLKKGTYKLKSKKTVA